VSANESAQAFLGEEFLTWLWFRRETEGGEFELGDRTVRGLPARRPDFQAAIRRDVRGPPGALLLVSCAA